MPNPNFPIFVTGIAVLDLVLSVNEIPNLAEKYRASDANWLIGGCAANAAIAIAKLGGSPQLASRIGDDEIGKNISQALIVQGVSTDALQISKNGRSSFSTVMVANSGERQIVNFRGSGLEDNLPQLINHARQRPFSAYLADTRWLEGAKASFKIAKELGRPAILDAEAPIDEELAMMASHVAFSLQGLRDFMAEENLEIALVAAAKRLKNWVCVTDGENGCYLTEEGRIMNIASPKIKAIDTLGAGDVWHGAFSLALAMGKAEAPAVLFANRAAALKCTKSGGILGAPSLIDYETHYGKI